MDFIVAADEAPQRDLAAISVLRVEEGGAPAPCEGRSWRGSGRVAAGDPDSLAAAVREMLDDSNLRESMGKRGKEWATSRFSWDTVARRMEQAYSAVLEQH